MTRPVRGFLLMLLARLLAALWAVWAVYRFLLCPDRSVEFSLGETNFHIWRQFWIWESAGASVHEGVVGDIRWGRSLVFLAVHIFFAASVWRRCVFSHPKTTRQPAGAPSGAGSSASKTSGGHERA